jgi:3-hydroxyacyl-[acyl-carrier-protein] dehydratase
MRWIWIDRFVAFESGKSARAVKNLSLAEDHFADHFPGYPVMPASLMLEGLAQTGGILVGEANGFREKVILAKVPYARFYRDVLAGQRVIYEATLLHLRPEGAAVAGRILLADDGPPQVGKDPSAVLVGEAEIFFAHLDQAQSRQLFGEHNFVFSGELKNILGLADVLGPAKEETAPRPDEGPRQ